MKLEQLISSNKASLSRIVKKQERLQQADPVPYINASVLVSGLVGSIRNIMANKGGTLTPTAMNMFLSAYQEAIEGILGIVLEKQKPTTCVYITKDEQGRLLKNT